jgi:cyclophilin family peptidyl-prolyl cis-trans isomerase
MPPMHRVRLARSLALALSLAACAKDDGGSGTSAGTGDGSGTSSGGAESSTTATTTSTAGTTDASSSSTGAVDESGSGSSTAAESSTGGGDGTLVTLETTLGDIVIQLDPAAAPITSENFLAYVESGFYDGTDGDGATIFHRVIPGFVIQGGGLREDMSSKPTMPPIVNEFGNGLTNVRGAISMARTNDPDSATSQFFINVVDNANLDVPPGYAVFGMVVAGMDVVDAIVAVPTTSMGPYDDVPVEPIPILSATVQ